MRLLLLLAVSSYALSPPRATRRSLMTTVPPAVASFVAPRADAALVCIDGKGPWCDGLERATNPRAEDTAARAAAYDAELAQASDAMLRRRRRGTSRSTEADEPPPETPRAPADDAPAGQS